MSDIQQKKISYLGIPGSYSHQACEDVFPGASYRGYKGFSAAINVVREGEVDCALIPVENSTAGRIAEVYNILPTLNLHIVGEYLLPIRHCLAVSLRPFRGLVPDSVPEEDILTWKKSPLTAAEIARAFADIREVQSHPQALMQCEGFIRKHFPGAETVAVADTATAARELSNRRDRTVAAIASRRSADIYNLFVLAENIEDDPGNMTRFLTFAREPLSAASIKGPAITSIVFQTGHQPGSLLTALGAFADAGVNLTKLETYMLNQRTPQPTFYVDAGAALTDPRMKQALEKLGSACAQYTILGCYPASPDRGKSNGFLPVAA